MPRNRKIRKPELVLSSSQLSFTAELEKKRTRARVFMEILMADQCRNVKYINTQVRLGDVNEEIRKKVLRHIASFQGWVSALLDMVNSEYHIYPHKDLSFFESVHKERQDLYVSYPIDAEELSEMLDRALSRLNSFFNGYKDIIEPFFTDYVKGSINQLKRAYLTIK